MARFQVDRRQFLAMSGGLMAGLTVGFPSLSAAGIRLPGSNHIVIYCLSARGRRRVSRAARKNAANKRFRTIEAARRGRAHRGDATRLSTLIVDRKEYTRLFVRGGKGRERLLDAVDLRHLS